MGWGGAGFWGRSEVMWVCGGRGWGCIGWEWSQVGREMGGKGWAGRVWWSGGACWVDMGWDVCWWVATSGRWMGVWDGGKVGGGRQGRQGRLGV
jgi:hypothetical protein